MTSVTYMNDGSKTVDSDNLDSQFHLHDMREIKRFLSLGLFFHPPETCVFLLILAGKQRELFSCRGSRFPFSQSSSATTFLSFLCAIRRRDTSQPEPHGPSPLHRRATSFLTSALLPSFCVPSVHHSPFPPYSSFSFLASFRLLALGNNIQSI